MFSKRQKKKLSTPERWEMKQMQAGSAITAVEMPDFDEEHGVLGGDPDGTVSYLD